MKKIILAIFLLASLSSMASLPLCTENRDHEWNKSELLGLQENDQSKPRRRSQWLIRAQDSFAQYNIEVSYYQETRWARTFGSRDQRIHNLIIFPTIDGEGVLETQLARYFSARNFQVAIVSIQEINQGQFDGDTSCRMDGMYRRIQEAAVIVAKKMKKHNPEGELFVAGASQGGIRSLIAAEVLPELRAVWANVAGGDFPSLYAQSEVEAITDFRKNHMKALDLENTDDYESYLREHLIFDPLQSCELFSPPLSLVVANQDTSVPTYNQALLRQSCPKAQVYELDSNHFRGVVELYLNRRSTREFFREHD